MDAIFDSFLSFDLGVFQWVQGIQNSVLTTIMVIITTLGDEGIIFIAMGLVLLFTKKYRKIGFAMLASLAVMVVCNNLVLKEIFARPRPYYIFNLDALLADKQMFIDAGKEARFDMLVEKISAGIERYPDLAAKWVAEYHFPNFIEKLTSLSFPSGHTSSAFAAAIAVLWYDRKIGIPTTIFAALMGFSRIYVQVHYCSDVLGAVVVGIIYALAGVLIAKLLFPVFEKVLNAVLGKLKKNKTEA